MRQVIARIPSCCIGRSSSGNIHYRIVAYYTRHRGQKKRLPLGVIHSDEPWGKIITNLKKKKQKQDNIKPTTQTSSKTNQKQYSNI